MKMTLFDISLIISVFISGGCFQQAGHQKQSVPYKEITLENNPWGIKKGMSYESLMKVMPKESCVEKDHNPYGDSLLLGFNVHVNSEEVRVWVSTTSTNGVIGISVGPRKQPIY